VCQKRDYKESESQKMIEIGRVYVKISGRDAGKKCVIVEGLKKGRVLIDGQTRRRLCNPAHLEPLPEKIDIKEGASHAEVVSALKKIGIEVKEKVKAKKKLAKLQATKPEKKELTGLSQKQ
jgi:large subunit ribosomal protein L14e